MSATLPCPHCKAQNPVTAGFCGRCGGALARQRRTGPPSSTGGTLCTACGFSGNRPGTTFCSECGVLLEVRRAAPARRRWLLGALLVLLATGAAAGGWWLSTGGPASLGRNAPALLTEEPQEPAFIGGAVEHDAGDEPDAEQPAEPSPEPAAGTVTPPESPTPSPLPSPTTTATETPAPTAGPAGSLAFVSDRDGPDSLYVLDIAAPATVRRLTTATGYDWWPTWCGPGELAFERADRWPRTASQEVYTVSMAGGPPAALTSPSYPVNSNFNGVPSCSSDGSLVAFSSRPRDAQASNQFGLGIVDRRTPGAPFDLVGDGYPLAGNASWSPDGGQLAFMHYVRATGRFTLYRVQLGGDEHNPDTLTSGGDTYKYPAWSPHGDRIAFACGRRDADQELVWGLCLADADGRNEARIVDVLHRGPEQEGENAMPRHAVTPSWSPDGRWIAVAADREGQWDIYLYEVATGNLSNLTQRPASDEIHPAWSRQ